MVFRVVPLPPTPIVLDRHTWVHMRHPVARGERRPGVERRMRIKSRWIRRRIRHSIARQSSWCGRDVRVIHVRVRRCG